MSDIARQSALTTAGKDAAKQLISLPELPYPKLAALAREVAMDIRVLDEILITYGLTRIQYDFLQENNEFYKQALHTLTIEWNSALSTPERLKIESAAILEDALPRLGARMQNQAEGLPGVIEAAKLFAKMAGVGEREANQAAPGEKFSITINLGGDEKIIVGAASGTTAGAATSLEITKPAKVVGADKTVQLPETIRDKP